MRTHLTLILLLAYCALHGQKATLSGVVTDAQNGETLVGATVLLKGNEFKGTITDANGFFSMPGIDTNAVQFSISYIGYEILSKSIDFTISKKQFVALALQPQKIILKQVDVIHAAADIIGDRALEISMHQLSPQAIRSIPAARNDVFRAIKYMPGIESTEPLSPLVSVRGSDPGENLIMLDGVTIYNPYHFLSSSGIFNMQTVKNVDMMIGGFGAEYGGRNASVIHIATRDGDQSGLHGEVEPTSAESKVFLEFPLGKKTTMMVAGRVNYDLVGNFMLGSNNYFYDTNLSITHRFNARNRLTLKYFGSKDFTNLDFNTIYRYLGESIDLDYFKDMSLRWINQWNNTIATAIYKSVLSPKLFFRAQVYASLHRANNFSEMKFNVEDVAFNTSTLFESKVNDLCAKANLDYKPLYWNSVKLGLEYNSYLFSNGSAVNKVANQSASKSPTAITAFIEDKIEIRDLVIRPGMRMSNFNNRGWMVEPRINAVLNLPANFKVKAAYGQYQQNIISMNTQEFEYNQFLDYYYPLTKKKPSLSYHYIFRLEKKINAQNTLSADIYFKAIKRTYNFDLTQSQHEAFALTDKIIEGGGEAYGLELMWQGRYKQLTGWASYTWSKSNRWFPHIMNGEKYPYDYDRRHSFKGVVNFQATDRISYSAAFRAQSGVPRSIETGFQMFYMYDPQTGTMIYSPQYTVSKKNGTQMPWLYYLDLGLQKEVVSGFGRNLAAFFGADKSFLTVNLYNVLFFRRNILYYIPVGDFDKFIPMGDNYLPMVSAGYTLKF